MREGRATVTASGGPGRRSDRSARLGLGTPRTSSRGRGANGASPRSGSRAGPVAWAGRTRRAPESGPGRPRAGWPPHTVRGVPSALTTTDRSPRATAGARRMPARCTTASVAPLQRPLQALAPGHVGPRPESIPRPGPSAARGRRRAAAARERGGVPRRAEPAGQRGTRAQPALAPVMARAHQSPPSHHAKAGGGGPGFGRESSAEAGAGATAAALSRGSYRLTSLTTRSAAFSPRRSPGRRAQARPSCPWSAPGENFLLVRSRVAERGSLPPVAPVDGSAAGPRVSMIWRGLRPKTLRTAPARSAHLGDLAGAAKVSTQDADGARATPMA
jgi:hypothetical protein